MTTSSTVLAIDIGTTATKGLLVANDALLARASVAYPLITTASGHAEQDPEAIVEAVREVVRQITSSAGQHHIDALSFSAAMHCLILLDRHQNALTPSIIWADRRADRQAVALRADPRGMALYHRTGTPIHPMAWPAKLRYFVDCAPALLEQAVSYLGIKEYVLLRLMGEWPCDHSIASATGLFNLKKLDWDDEGMEWLGLERSKLPQLCSTSSVLTLGQQGANALGLSPGTKVVVGASDGCLSNLGAGALTQGVAALTIGTSGALRTVVARPQTDRLMRTFCYVLGEHHYVVGGAVNGGGMALNWLSDLLSQENREAKDELRHASFDALFALAATIAPGSDSLLFHPYLSGERAPLWNSDATGSFVGLTMNHHHAHMVRAVIEGILLNLYLVLQALEDSAGRIDRILAVGGFLRADFTRQLLADVFDRAIEFPAELDSSAIGAARLAALALGDVASLDDFQLVAGDNCRCTPNRDAAAVYRRMHKVYGELPQAMTTIYAALATLKH